MINKILTPSQALPKIKQYCSYQERCHQEVKDKLYSYGLHRKDVEEIISQLIVENHLNEERFAMQYSGGKFRMKQWGINKIKQGLSGKGISEYNLRKALKSIDTLPYRQTFEKLALKKWELLKNERNIFAKKKKLKDYLLQKGYEQPLIYEWLNKQTTK